MEKDKVIIECRDSLQAMKELPENSVDLIITDPPYQFSHLGGGCFGNQHREYHAELKDITDGISDEYLEEMCRVMKTPNIYIWCNKDQIYQYSNFFIPLGCTMDILCWHKSNPIPMSSNTYLPDTEYCLFFRKKAPMYGSYETKHKYWVTPVNKDDKDRWGHPTIKPLSIIENLVVNSSRPGDVVLDPFMGSGTTGVACVMHDRDFIGYDVEQKYVDVADKRIKLAKAEKNIRGLDKWIQ